MDIEQIKNRVANGYYKSINPDVNNDVEWLINQFELHIDELADKTEALKRIADLHIRGVEDTGANEHRRIASEALAR